MNWKLILYLSLFGLIMAFGTISFIPMRREPFFWLAIFLVCAYWIAAKCSGNFFWHGFLVSLANSVWITGAHVFFYSTYMANHPQMAGMNAHMPLPEHPRLMMLMMGPVIGAASGIILGLFALIASRLVKRSPAGSQE